jgi:hypothetical protein
MRAHRPTMPPPLPDLAEQVEAWMAWVTFKPCRRCGCEGILCRGLCGDCCGQLLWEY